MTDSRTLGSVPDEMGLNHATLAMSQLRRIQLLRFVIFNVSTYFDSETLTPGPAWCIVVFLSYRAAHTLRRRMSVLNLHVPKHAQLESSFHPTHNNLKGGGLHRKQKIVNDSFIDSKANCKVYAKRYNAT